MNSRLIAWLAATAATGLVVALTVQQATAAELALTLGGSFAGEEHVMRIATLRGTAAGLSVAAVVGALGFLWDAVREEPDLDSDEDGHPSDDYRW